MSDSGNCANTENNEEISEKLNASVCESWASKQPKQVEQEKNNNPENTISYTYLLYIVFWKLFTIGGSAFIVFGMNQSVW